MYPPSSSSRIMAFAHFFGLLALLLMLVWLLHYREGLDLDSNDGNRVFNVHPFLMYFGFIFLMGQGMMAFKTVGGHTRMRKFVHMGIHLCAIVLGIVGIHAVFKFHDIIHISHIYTFHSWLGITTFCLFILQWLVGQSVFMFRATSAETRQLLVPSHINAGRVLLLMAICTAVTGLVEKFTFLKLQEQHEARLMNFLGFSIVIFGIFVELSVTLPRMA